MTKILHIITRLDMGGSAQNTLLTCRETAGAYEVVLAYGLARESGMTRAEEAALAARKREALFRGVKFIPIPSLVRPIRPLRDFQALWSLIWYIWLERPDIVHTHTSKAGILGRLAARIAGVPRIVHTPHGHVFYGHFDRITARLFLALERRFGRFTDRLVALTEGERRDYIDLKVDAPGDIRTIHSGIELDGFCAPGVDPSAKKKALGLDPQAGIIGFTGWLLPIKGPIHLLNAMPKVWERHPHATLVLAGKGALESDLRHRADALGANGRVRFLGWREDIAEIMPIFDVFVLPSLNEGMGRVLVEAMAAGKPVVASRVGGVPEVVRHGETGILVAPRDEDAIAESINQLLADPARAGGMGKKGRQCCREFSLEAMIEKLDALYRDLAEGYPAGAGQTEEQPAPWSPGCRAPSKPEETCLPPG